MGGANPLAGTVPPIASLRNTTDVIAVHADDAEPEFPVLAAGLRDARLESLSIAPLMNDGESLGVLVCFFRRHREFDERSFDLKRALGRQAAQTLVRIRLQRRLEHLALYDQLTGVANRQLLQQSLDAAIGISARANEPLALVFLDLDEFKSINDRWGHAAGDTVLREVASRLREAVRAGDIVGRIGGDEFVAICANSDPHDGESIAERILAVTHEPILLQGVAITVAVSAGIATYRPDTDPRPTGDQLLIRADAAMYSSKTRARAESRWSRARSLTSPRRRSGVGVQVLEPPLRRPGSPAATRTRAGAARTRGGSTSAPLTMSVARGAKPLKRRGRGSVGSSPTFASTRITASAPGRWIAEHGRMLRIEPDQLAARELGGRLPRADQRGQPGVDPARRRSRHPAAARSARRAAAAGAPSGCRPPLRGRRRTSSR